MITMFDTSVIRTGSMSFDLAGTSIESGRSMSGLTGSIDYSSGGYWTLEYKNIFIETRDQHRYWSSLRNRLSGGVSNIIVPIDQHGSAPIPGSEEFIYSHFSDGSVFSDGYAHSSGSVTAFSYGTWGIGSSTVSFNLYEGSDLIGGETFSVYHSTYGHRAYSINEIDDKVGSLYTVSIRPPLRDTLENNSVMEFLHPKCMMRLMPNTKLPMEAKPPWHNTSATISFVESFSV